MKKKIKTGDSDTKRMTDKEVHALTRPELLQLLVTQGHEMGNLNEKYEVLNHEFELIHDSNSRLQARISDREAEIQSLNEQLEHLKEKLNDKDERLDAKDSEIKALREQLSMYRQNGSIEGNSAAAMTEAAYMIYEYLRQQTDSGTT